MPRNALPVELHVINGNPNRLTKADIESRKAAQIKIGDLELSPPAYITRNPVALDRWHEVVSEYRRAGVEFVTSSDVAHLARACEAHSQYIDLVEHRRRLSSEQDKPFTLTEAQQFLGDAREQYGEVAAAKLWARIDFLMSLKGILDVDKALNAKGNALNALEDRLFLNPLAKVKNIPKREKAKEKPAGEMEMFG